MGRRLLGAVVRAVVWNAALGAVLGLAAFAALVATVAGDVGGDGATVVSLLGAPYALAIGTWLGLQAGVVHGLAQVPVVLARPARPRLVVRCVATPLSAALAWYLLTVSDDVARWWLVAPFVAYVLLTPLVAAWGYEDARTAAALSAARRSGPSSASRVSGSESESSRATSE